VRLEADVMQAARLTTVALVASLLASSLCVAWVAEGPAWTEERLIDAALRASGTQDVEDLARRREAVQREMDAIVERLDLDGPTVRGARRLHRLLHRRYLLTYEAEEDSLTQLLDHGRYNCLSGTLFYGLIARRLGYDPVVVKLPGHLLLRLEVGGRSLDVETTVLDGFDFGYFSSLRPSHEPSLTSSRLLLEWPYSTAWSRQRAGRAWMLPLEAAVGYAWLNRGWRDLEAGEPLSAARSVLEAEPLLGDLLEREETVGRLLARAFRDVYERGGFDEAYRIAIIDARLFPEKTTANDRLLAVGLKRIEILGESGDAAGADQVRHEVVSLVQAAGDRARFDRRTCPLIAATAVRSGKFDLARELAERYAAVEPDPVEAERFLAWVEERTAPTEGRETASRGGPRLH